MHRFLVAASAFILLALAGCSTSVTVDSDFPEPVNHSLPVRAGLLLEEDFLAYTFERDKGHDITLALGNAQGELFRNVADHLFASVRELEALPQGDSGLDLILSPRVEDIQLATPFDTKLEVFEVWIKYNIRVYRGDGEPLADWIMTAYGKTPTRFLKSRGEALNRATVVALRDAGARLIIEFPRVPAVYNWLKDTIREKDASTGAGP